MRDFDEAINCYKQSADLSNRKVSLPLLKLGWAYVRTKQYVDGVKTLKTAIKIEPENPIVLTKIGEVLLRDDDKLDEAEGFLKKALALNPEQNDAIVALGRI